jgi:hypothetical protein
LPAPGRAGRPRSASARPRLPPRYGVRSRGEGEIGLARRRGPWRRRGVRERGVRVALTRPLRPGFDFGEDGASHVRDERGNRARRSWAAPLVARGARRLDVGMRFGLRRARRLVHRCPRPVLASDEGASVT